MFVQFPPGFVWGTATAAYQIEGATDADGKEPSIWDSFTHRRGTVGDRSTGDVACDHYHRYPEDVEIMSQLGIRAYRFSLSWPRILTSSGPNPAGLDFYSRLVDRLLESNITPYVTLYHWDLPQRIQDTGGWLNRDTSERLADYAAVAVSRLGDRITNWITLNEPLVATVWGYGLGIHAPGIKKPYRAALAGHHMLLAHGKALEAIHANGRCSVGITHALQPIYNYRLDRAGVAYHSADTLINRFWLDPVFRGEYPPRLRNYMSRLVGSGNLDRDLAIISRPVDFLGINNYTRMVVRPSLRPIFPFAPVLPRYPGVRTTEMGWEVYPNALFETIMRVTRDYGRMPIVITENGAAYRDVVESDGIHDPVRVEYLARHILSVHRAIAEGADVRGYFVWTLMDNFEWAEGFTKPFGIVHVDRTSLCRIVKDSGYWYSTVCRNNGYDTRFLERTL
jgi:beta-glucosidase